MSRAGIGLCTTRGRASVRAFLCRMKPNVQPRRLRQRKGPVVASNKPSPSESALRSLDKQYWLQLGNDWPPARIAMLCEPMYGALLNNTIDTDACAKSLEARGARDFVKDALYDGIPDLSEGRRDVDVNSDFTPDPTIDLQGATHGSATSGATAGSDVTKRISPNILCYTFPRGEVTRLPEPSLNPPKGILDYHIMDPAALLPVLALGVQYGDRVLDLCAAPGNKTLALLQTGCCSNLVVNDSLMSRLNRLRHFLRSFLPHVSGDLVDFVNSDGRSWPGHESSTFDKVLVDVPCSADRHSILQDEDNIFINQRSGERRELPALQLSLLMYVICCHQTLGRLETLPSFTHEI
uniref:5-cytosine rRNA methyltransferase NSUN4 n=1 Tax=Eptatretus burgeri TaxID=7764 RepID=A0A8C4NIX7_EPTBU